VKAPSLDFTEEQWAPAMEHAKRVDREDKYVTAMVASGIFEMTHHLIRMENALLAY